MNEMLLPALGDSTLPYLLKGVYSNLAAGSIGRNGQCMALIGNSIYAFSGSFGSLNTVMEKYDIEANTWSIVTPNNAGPTGRHSPGYCVLNGKLYLFGGSTGTSWGPMSNEAWCFDFATLLWTKLANYPVSLALVSACAINGKIYLLGGFTGSGASSPFHEYDPATDTYRTIAHSRSARYGHKAVAVDGKMYLFGGSIGPSAVSEAWSYDPATNIWTALKQMAAGKPHSYVAVIGYLIYIFGGRQGNEPQPINKLYRYNTQTGNWTELPSGPTSYYLGGCVATESAMYLHCSFDMNTNGSFNFLQKIT
ncbi:N-acetylneuraminate epimerase precursor [compost metagenome]